MRLLETLLDEAEGFLGDRAFRQGDCDLVILAGVAAIDGAGDNAGGWCDFLTLEPGIGLSRNAIIQRGDRSRRHRSRRW